MKTRCTSLPLLLAALAAAGLRAQDTFSLLGYDRATGEIVSAGASCIDADALPPDGVAAISSVWPGRGAVHTQSFYEPANQRLGDSLLRADLPAEGLLTALLAQDATGTPALRQYLVLTARPDISVAAFTGGRCYTVARQVRGEDFVVAGNILLDSTVVQAIATTYAAARERGAWIGEAALEALQSVAYPGADRRCLSAGLSSRSAFLRVARPSDPRDTLFLDLRVPYPAGDTDPLVLLADAYRAWAALPEHAVE